MVVVLNKKLNQKGYKSSIIRINKYKNREIRNINKGDYVIFQMSGYGYHNKGLPFWLINQIKLSINDIGFNNTANTIDIFLYDV